MFSSWDLDRAKMAKFQMCVFSLLFFLFSLNKLHLTNLEDPLVSPQNGESLVFPHAHFR